MTDTELEQRLRAFYQADVPADEAAPAALRSVVSAIPQVSPAPPPRLGSGRGVRLLAIAAVLTSAAIGAALLAGGSVDLPAVVVPSDAPSIQPSPDVQASDTVKLGRIIYTRATTLRKGEADCTTSSGFCHRRSVFIANADGSDERLLVPGTFSYLLAVSPDGSSVLISVRDPDGDHLYLTDADGSAPRRFDSRCDTPCADDFAFAFSPDGSRLAFLRTDETGSLAIMDVATGAVEELHATDGIAGPPGWSPDGLHLAFKNHVVDVDGRNLREIAPASLFTGLFGEPGTGYSAPQWSPDGSRIAFASFNDTFPTNPPEQNSQRLMDIYVVHPDGTELRRLTTETVPPLGTNEAGDFGASFPAWTRDGRITYIDYPVLPNAQIELWVIDADGTDATRLDPNDAGALTALGCVICTFPAQEELMVPNFAYWIPAP